MFVFKQSRVKSEKKLSRNSDSKIRIMNIVKQSVGIDVAMDTFAASIMVKLSDDSIKHLEHREFKNDFNGFEAFSKWVNKYKKKEIPLPFVMEATGVYYEDLAYYLHNKEEIVNVLLPNKAKKYAESFNIKSKTDKIDSKMLGQMGVERKLDPLRLAPKHYRHLRKLSRERQQLKKETTKIKNQLHAEEHSGDTIDTSLDRMHERIEYIDKQVKSIEGEMKQLVKEHELLNRKITLLMTIKGVAFITAAGVIAETQGFANFTSIKQLTSYAGYDVSLKQSGKYNGKSKISKKGNSHIRQLLYMPALSSITHSNRFRKFYDRVNEGKPNNLIGLTAVQRKLLGLMFTLCKNDTEYDENYQSKTT